MWVIKRPQVERSKGVFFGPRAACYFGTPADQRKGAIEYGKFHSVFTTSSHLDNSFLAFLESHIYLEKLCNLAEMSDLSICPDGGNPVVGLQDIRNAFCGNHGSHCRRYASHDSKSFKICDDCEYSFL